jgi:hypothetical protein
MEERAVRLLEIAVARHTQELSPRFPAGMAVGAEVPATPTPVIGAVLVGTELLLRVDGTLTSSRVGQEKRRGTRSLGMGMGCLLIGITQRFIEEARKGLRCFGALAWWRNGLGSLGQAEARSLGHRTWSRKHSHSRATSRS